MCCVIAELGLSESENANLTESLYFCVIQKKAGIAIFISDKIEIPLQGREIFHMNKRNIMNFHAPTNITV